MKINIKSITKFFLEYLPGRMGLLWAALFWWFRKFKILDQFITKAYFETFLKSFFGILFILVLQFLSRYQDQIFGKGLDTLVILRIFAYASVSLIVLTLPVAVLLSSLISLGTLGENSELAAFRSSGVSLYRIVRTMFVTTFGIAMVSFMLSVYLLPMANLKLYSLLYDVKQVKPTFTLKEGHFYSGIEGYVIRVEGKNNQRDMLYGITIFDHTKEEGDERVVMADSGQLYFNADAFYMRMTLFHGVGHQTMKDDPNNPGYPYSRYYFDTLVYKFDLSKFGLQRTSESAFSTHHYMQNISELVASIDSMAKEQKRSKAIFRVMMRTHVPIDSTIKTYRLPDSVPRQQGRMLMEFPEEKRLEIMAKSLEESRKVQEKAKEKIKKEDKDLHALRDYQIEYHGKFALPAACLLFLLIGAPLGAVIRRGGLGFPIVASVFLFLVFYVVLMQGKKMAGEGIIPPWMGSWLPLLVLSPLAVFFMLQSSGDAKLLDVNFWYPKVKFVRRVLGFMNPLRWLMKFGPSRKLLLLIWNLIRRINPLRRFRRRGAGGPDDPFNTKGSGGFDEKDW